MLAHEKKNCAGSPRKGWSGEITSTVCVFLALKMKKKTAQGARGRGGVERLHLPVCVFFETEHCVLFLSQKEMVGDDGFSVGREDGVRFSTPTSIWSGGQNSQGRCWLTLDIVLQNL